MPEQKKQLRVAFYIRVSTDDQVEKFGIPLQRSSIEALIKSKGKLDDGTDAMVLAGEQYIYIDEGISGTKEYRDRPAFARLIEDIELAPEGQKPFDAIVVYKIDRFARRLRILLGIVEFLDEHGIMFLSANESIDTSSAFGKAILGIIGVIAELEIETTRLRTQDGRKQAVDRGIVMGQTTTYGFQKDQEGKLTPLTDEAKVVKDIFNWFVYERIPVQKIADRLKDLSILSPDASAVRHKKRKGGIQKRNDAHFWRIEAVKKILSNRIYIGEYWHSKTTTDKKTKKTFKLPSSEWKLSSYKYPPLIEPALFMQAQKYLEMYIKRVKFNNEETNMHLYLLSGLLKCANCANNNGMISWTGDRKLISKNSAKFSYYYKCTRKNRKKYSAYCTVLPIPAEPLEEYVLRFVMKLLENPEMVYKHQKELLSSRNSIIHISKLREDYIKSLNSIPSRIDAIRSQNTLGIIDSNKMMEEITEQEKSKKRYQSEIDKIDQQLGKHELSEGYMEAFKEFSERYSVALEELANPKKRKELINIVHSIIDRIIIQSRNVLPIDSIAGRKKDGQFMPYGIEIKLRLPEEIIIALAKQEFGVKTDNVWPGRGSNPHSIAGTGF